MRDLVSAIMEDLDIIDLIMAGESPVLGKMLFNLCAFYERTGKCSSYCNVECGAMDRCAVLEDDGKITQCPREETKCPINKAGICFSLPGDPLELILPKAGIDAGDIDYREEIAAGNEQTTLPKMVDPLFDINGENPMSGYSVLRAACDLLDVVTDILIGMLPSSHPLRVEIDGIPQLHGFPVKQFLIDRCQKAYAPVVGREYPRLQEVKELFELIPAHTYGICVDKDGFTLKYARVCSGWLDEIKITRVTEKSLKEMLEHTVILKEAIAKAKKEKDRLEREWEGVKTFFVEHP